MAEKITTSSTVGRVTWTPCFKRLSPLNFFRRTAKDNFIAQPTLWSNTMFTLLSRASKFATSFLWFWSACLVGSSPSARWCAGLGVVLAKSGARKGNSITKVYTQLEYISGMFHTTSVMQFVCSAVATPPRHYRKGRHGSYVYLALK